MEDTMAKNFLCSNSEPVVQTKQGKIRGFLFDGVYAFHGVKYANSGRFLPPEPVKPWDGVKDALNYGYISPTLNPPIPSGEIMIPHLYWPDNENCQYLNVWTKSIDRQAKMPVMVWIHGGGYTFGSGIELVAVIGDNLAKYGEVVVVSMNHRLNILGYFDLSSFNAKYKNSGNAGQEDLVESLKWVHDNIAAFGGDPDNVTIFGQSGGGAKVTTLGQIPAATGLYHKAIVMSGVGTTVYLKEFRNDRELAMGILSELNLKENEIEELETVPFVILARAVNRTIRKMVNEGKPIMRWAPAANDYYIGNPMDVGFGAHTKNISTIVGSVIGEFGFTANIPDKNTLTASERRAVLAKNFGSDTDRALEIFKRTYPEKNEVDLLSTDHSLRSGVLRYSGKKAEESSAPVYTYIFTLEFPYNDGKLAWHCADIPFAFHSCEKVGICNIEGGVTERLEEQVCGAFVNFAKTGNPNHSSLPDWKPFTDKDRFSMIFDRTSEAKKDHDAELINFLTKVLPPHNFRVPSPAENDETGRAWLY
jgi:para-nitrobenzyl esterase